MERGCDGSAAQRDQPGEKGHDDVIPVQHDHDAGREARVARVAVESQPAGSVDGALPYAAAYVDGDADCLGVWG